MKPSALMSGTCGQIKNAISPRHQQVVGVINTVGIEESIAFGSLVVFAARALKEYTYSIIIYVLQRN